MKKLTAILLALALAAGMAVLPAMAEEENTQADGVTSATTQQGSQTTGKGGRNNRNNRNGQPPQAPGQNGQSAQPQFPGQNGQQQAPGQNYRQGKGSGSRNNPGGKGGRFGKHMDLDQMLKDGVITQEVYDAIRSYMDKQAAQEQPESTAPAEGETPAEGAEPPAQPDGAADGPQGAEEQMLKDLLESGAITQEQYDQLLGRIAAVSGI